MAKADASRLMATLRNAPSGAVSEQEMAAIEQALPTFGPTLQTAFTGSAGSAVPSGSTLGGYSMSPPDEGRAKFPPVDVRSQADTRAVVPLLPEARYRWSDEPSDPRSREEVRAQIDQKLREMHGETDELADQGRMGDVSMAHLTPGDVVIPPELIQNDPELQAILQQRFEAAGIDPASRVSGSGVASLNPMTGAEEFGLSRLAKKLRKIIRPVAKAAQFVEGPWQGIASLVDKAGTAYDVAKGRADPSKLLTVMGPGRIGPSIGESIENISKRGDGGFWKGLGKSFSEIPGAFMGGLGSLRDDPMGTVSKLFESQNPEDYIETITDEGDRVYQNKITGEEIKPERYENLMSRSGAGIQALTGGLQGMLFGREGPRYGDEGNIEEIRKWGEYDPETGTSPELPPTFRDKVTGKEYFEDPRIDGGGFLTGGGDRRSTDGSGGGAAGGGAGGDGFISKLLGGLGLGAGAGGGGLGSLGQLAMAGIPAYMLGKLAMDEARRDKGVPLTPLTTMGPTGRYNIEAEIARRMGNARPNPVEFGLLPAGTLPQLSGGRPLPRERLPQPMNYGGGIRAYAGGGDVSVNPDVFVRMNGGINGAGTETSDEIPAMLSDGEFVFNGRSVRGAGSFDMHDNGSGIVSLVPNGRENREKGTNLMYQMMDLFENYANA